MENASKALLMAGSVLLSVLIVGLLVLMFNGLSNVESSRTQTKEIEQASKVNETLEAYNRRLLYGTDIISICNLISDYNERYGATNNPTEGYTEIEVEITIKKDIFNDSDVSELRALGEGTIDNLRSSSTDAETIKNEIVTLENCSKVLAEENINGYQIAFLAQKDDQEVNELVTGDYKSGWVNGSTSEAKHLKLYKKTLEYLKNFKRKLFTCAPDGEAYSEGNGVVYDPNGNGSIIEMYFTELE